MLDWIPRGVPPAHRSPVHCGHPAPRRGLSALPPRPRLPRGTGAASLGAYACRRIHRAGRSAPRQNGNLRRRREPYLRGAAPPHQRGRSWVGRTGDPGGAQRRDHEPQPPRVRRSQRGVLEAGRKRPVPEHLFRRPSGRRGHRARGRRGDRLRPGVHGRGAGRCGAAPRGRVVGRGQLLAGPPLAR